MSQMVWMPWFKTYQGQQAEWDGFAKVLAPYGISIQPIDALQGPIPTFSRGQAVLWQGASDYHRYMPRFNTWLDAVDASGVPSLNSTALIRWNSDKRYLQELELRASIPALSTLWLDAFNAKNIRDWAEKQDYAEIVIKPVISAGAHLTFRLALSDNPAFNAIAEAYAAEAPRPVMVQPFAPEILDQGELSFLFFGGKFSHAVRKTPKAGDYRIQHVHGGSYVRFTPDSAMLEQATYIFSSLPERPVYARVDGIWRDGRLLLMEVELIEPYFYLSAAPEQYAMLAEALADEVGVAA